MSGSCYAATKGSSMKAISSAAVTMFILSAVATTGWAGNPPPATPFIAPAANAPVAPAVKKKAVKPAKRIIIKSNNAKPMIQIRHPSTPYNP